MNKTAANRSEWDLTQRTHLPRDVMLTSYMGWGVGEVWRVGTSASKVTRRRVEVGLAVGIQGYGSFPGQCHNAESELE